jgi:hypothetical protein
MSYAPCFPNVPHTGDEPTAANKGHFMSRQSIYGPIPAGSVPRRVDGRQRRTVRRAEAGQAEALNMIFGILELDGRHDWYQTAPEVLLSRLGKKYDSVMKLDDGLTVAQIARAFHLREELAIAAALQVIEDKT